MPITSNDGLNEGYEYKIDMAANGGGIWLDRTFPFKKGESVSFHVRLESDAGMTLVDLQRGSIQRAIEMLQAMLDPAEPPPSKGSIASRLP